MKPLSFSGFFIFFSAWFGTSWQWNGILPDWANEDLYQAAGMKAPGGTWLSDTGYIDPDEDRNVSQLITSKGYPIEEHIVNSDGYLLYLIRIPRGRDRKKPKDPRKVVYFQHGVLATCDCFVLDFPADSLPYILADRGYDVWLGNYRGTSLTRRHVRFPTNSREFWNFGVDELALVDLPNLIDYVLQKTGMSSLYYIGHSQGTLTSYMLLSEKRQYNKKIRINIALAPVSRLADVRTPITRLIPTMLSLEPILMSVGPYEFAQKNEFQAKAVETFCRERGSIPPGLCAGFMYMLGGFNPNTLNKSRLAVYNKHVPAGTSMKNVIHLCQMCHATKFQKYDYGKEQNRKLYFQDAPPEYNPARMTAPTALFVGANDYLAGEEDSKWLWARIRNRALYYLVPDPYCAHYDFVVSMNAKDNIYPAVVSLMEKY